MNNNSFLGYFDAIGIDNTWQDAKGNSIKPLLDELEKVK
jgi:hypothetical protein